jgi:gliding motility-associated-like protein
MWSDTTTLSFIDGVSVFARPTQTTEYTLTLIDSLGCSATDLIRIIVDRREAVYIPNAFSPNGDGVNDALTVFADNTVASVNRFLVFDRWGAPVFENYDFQPNDLSQGWDGIHRSEPANVGVYVYLAEVLKVDGTTVLMKGDISLLR